MAKTYRQVTEDLMRMPTTADRSDELRRIVAYVTDYFSDLPSLSIRRYEDAGKPSVVIGTSDTLTPRVLLLGHLDVVPAAPELFEPRMEGAILHGRGSCDMKSECAVMMELMREFASHATPPSVSLMLTTDEEIGGQHGARYLIETIGYRPMVALVPDGGDAPDDIIVKSKGVLHVRLTATGHTAHGSRPWLGENAIEKLAACYQKVCALFPSNPDPNRWYSTCMIGTIRGGQATNQVPDRAECALDIRFTEEKRVGELFEAIREAADGCEVELLMQGNASRTRSDDPSLAVYADVLSEQLGLQPRFGQSHGADDGRFLSAQGIPIIVSRPRSGGQHGETEWVDLESLEQFKQLYRTVIEKFARNKGNS